MDHIISELDNLFSDSYVSCAKLLGLVPSVISKTRVDFSAAVELYQGDMPSRELFDQEVLRWQIKWVSVPKVDRPQSCASAIKSCCKISFSNVYLHSP